MIRSAVSSDIPALARIHITSWQTAYRGILSDEVLSELSVEQFETNWEKSFADTQRTNLALEIEGNIGGFVAFGNSRDRDATPNTAAIYGIYLAPKLWGFGYGQALWTEASQCLLSKFSVITLWVLQNNIRARKFYERIGFKYDEKIRDILLYGTDLSEVRYRKQL